MNDQSPNNALHASSFLDGANADYIDQMQARHAQDPSSVDAAWAAFFDATGDDHATATRNAQGPSWARADWPPAPSDDLTGALTPDLEPETVCLAEPILAGDRVLTPDAGLSEDLRTWPGVRSATLVSSLPRGSPVSLRPLKRIATTLP